MQIAQITWIAYPNFGTFLQAYALQQILKSMGHDSILIDDTRFTWLANTPRIRMARFKAMLLNPSGWLRNRRILRSYRLFADKYLKIDRSWRTERELNEKYDAFVCGSDQIWSPLLPQHFGGFYFAAFADKKVKIAYGPSLGSTCVTPEYVDMVRPWLSSFSSLSAREKVGAEILASITGRGDVETVLDPTLLLDSDSWNTLISGCDMNFERESYVLAYFLTFNNVYLSKAREIADKQGCKLIVIDIDVKMKPYADVFYRSAGPADFLWLVANARYVVTDSFHGSIFACQFKRPFLTVKRFKDSAANCQNSRIENLFKILGITDNFRGEENIDRLPVEPDWLVVTAALESYRKHSMNYLHSALK